MWVMFAEKGKKVSFHWFRHGLRLHDNPAFLEALKDCDEIFPIFIFDGETAGTQMVGYNRMTFLLESLHDLDTQLRTFGGQLFLFQGSPVHIFKRFWEEVGLQKVCFEQQERNPEPMLPLEEQRGNHRFTVTPEEQGRNSGPTLPPAEQGGHPKLLPIPEDQGVNHVLRHQRIRQCDVSLYYISYPESPYTAGINWSRTYCGFIVRRLSGVVFGQVKLSSASQRIACLDYSNCKLCVG
uniref:Photolyase/cryptochrome alpha/beta domain-containing protein n=1 Tax=Timema poppense TaxID=170557 RepID=A0A7R9DD73_TIMPO|nr:unnamed protein product [Timema poppensis]